MSVVADTTVVSNFASIGELNLLRQLYGTLHVSTEVYEEVRAGLDEGYHFYVGIEQLVHPFAAEGWIRLTTMVDEQELRYFGELPPGLHAGEASSLAIARHRDWLLLTDDRAARAESQRLGVRLSGSIGCLVLAVERGLYTLGHANQLLAAMIRQGYHSPVSDLTPLLKR